MTNNITKPNKNEIAKQEDVYLDISNLQGFDLGELTPANLILVQGSNDLKDKVQCKDGDFLLDNAVVPQPLEFMLIRTDKFYDEYEPIALDAQGKIPKGAKYLGTRLPKDVEKLGLIEEKNKIFYHHGEGGSTRLFQCKRVFLISIKGVPVKIIFKSTSKHYNAKNLFQKIVSACKQNDLVHSLDAVFELTAIKRKNEKANSTYWVFDVNFKRKSTEKELIDAAQFVNMNLAQEAVHDDDDLF